MIPGIFETVFPRESLDHSIAALKKAGFSAVQFDLASSGLDPWNSALEPAALRDIRQSAASHSVDIAAVSGTFNMAHPDRAHRERGLEGLIRVIEAAPVLGANLVTLCTGTRDTTSMWHWHSDNTHSAAWSDMLEMVTRSLEHAARAGVTLVVEPEPANVVASAAKARQLLDEVQSDHLKIVLDPANIVLSDRTRSPESVLTESFDLLGADIVFAHAKDLGEQEDFRAAGTGIVPWSLYGELLRGIGYNGPVIFHTLTEADVPTALAVFSGVLRPL